MHTALSVDFILHLISMEMLIFCQALLYVVSVCMIHLTLLHVFGL